MQRNKFSRQMLPDESYNRELLENAHPPAWRNPEPLDQYNLVIIGGGPAGIITAHTAANLGAKVALVDREDQS